MSFEDGLKIILTGVGYISLLYVLVKPGSNGPVIITELTNGFGNIIRAASGQPVKPLQVPKTQ